MKSKTTESEHLIKKLDKNDVEFCRQINKKYGPIYYFATYFYPREIRRAIWVVYAFLRVADIIVDDPVIDRPVLKLGEFAGDWIKAYNGNKVDSPVLRATAVVWHRYNIPFNYSEDFLAAMAQDLEEIEYKTLDDVKEYMHGSASVVGLIISHITGFVGGKDTMHGAKLLGDAMQLTNFIRDVHEDVVDRNRIYLATSDMEKFGVRRDDIMSLRNTKQTRALIKYYVELVHTWYEEAQPYINRISVNSRLPIRIAAALYQEQLYKIELKNYNVFEPDKVKLTKIEKIKIAFKTWKYSRSFDRL